MRPTTKTIATRIPAVLQKLTSLSLTIQFGKELSPCFGALETAMRHSGNFCASGDGNHQDYTMADFADDLAWLCTELALIKPIVVGHSRAVL